MTGTRIPNSDKDLEIAYCTAIAAIFNASTCNMVTGDTVWRLRVKLPIALPLRGISIYCTPCWVHSDHAYYPSRTDPKRPSVRAVESLCTISDYGKGGAKYNHCT